DRGFDGFQGAFFGTAAVNYEHLGTEPTSGFPLVQIDPGDDPTQWYVYPNHPSTVPLVAWWSLHAFGPEAWADRGDAVAAGTEAALRAPFFAFQLLGALALAIAVGRLAGRRAGLT